MELFPFLFPALSRWMSVCLSIHLSICISFPDDNLSKHQWIFSKLGICIDIVEIWFLILMGKFDGVICPRHADKKKNGQVKGMISMRMLILSYRIQVVISNIFNKFQNPKCSSS